MACPPNAHAKNGRTDGRTNSRELKRKSKKEIRKLQIRNGPPSLFAQANHGRR